MEVPEYELPERAIAQTPVEPRHSARLLDALAPSGVLVDRTVRDLPDLVEAGDVVVVNNSRVIPARLRLTKGTGGAAEVLLLEPHGPGDVRWRALVRPGRRLAPGTELHAREGGDPLVKVGGRLDEDGRREIEFLEDPAEVMARCGEMALPPYIHAPLEEPDRYQTVYAAEAGSVAAPTAGLHLTREVLDEIEGRGATVHSVDLHVGLGTFRPITSDQAEDHVMHREYYSVPPPTWKACEQARRVVAIGTTTVRALESAAGGGAPAGWSELFIRPGFRFSVVDVLLTNFHLPRSTLLLLLEAFAGTRWREIYGVALARGYRFLSFGDAMIVGRM
jgi:S-adenosylmethionine:tRNA ribosyltransferase-isomerase